MSIEGLGDLSVRGLVDMNLVFLARLCWRFFRELDELLRRD